MMALDEVFHTLGIITLAAIVLTLLWFLLTILFSAVFSFALKQRPNLVFSFINDDQALVLYKAMETEVVTRNERKRMRKQM